MDDRLFFSASTAFIGGIWCASFLHLDASLSLLCSVISLSFIVFMKPRGFMMACACSAVAFSLGAGRMSMVSMGSHALDESVSDEVSLSGAICDEPQPKDDKLRFCFEPEGHVDRILVSTARYPEYSYGDVVTVTGTLELPDNFDAYEGGPTFDYVSYLAKDGVRYVIRKARVEAIGENRGNPVKALLFKVKGSFVAAIDASMPEPYASLAAGIILGERGLLSDEVNTAFKRSGLTHILVLSGSNVSVIAGALLKTLSALPRAAGLWTGASAIILFAVMTGASATTVRASVMALIFLLAGGVGRSYDVRRALVFAAVAMLVQNPMILAFDISFQLSFLATLALIFAAPIASHMLSWVPERWGLREILATTVATQIFTTPFILHAMGEISVIALIPNVLGLPFVPAAMLGSFLSGLFGLFSSALAMPSAWITDLLLWYMVKTVSFWSSFPFATIRLSYGEPFVIGSYLLYAVLIWRWRRRSSSRSRSN